MGDGLTKEERSEKIHFDKVAQDYDLNYSYLNPFTKYKNEKKSKVLKEFINRYPIKKNVKVLEIGCGTGEYTRRLAKKLPKAKITALDISENIIQLAKKKCKGCKNVSFKVGSAYKTGYRKESFDAIFGFYVLHHLDIEKFRREARRILKPGGIIFFYEPNILNPVVFLVKSNKTIKRMVGDSPNEWAINPLRVKKQLPGFKILEVFQSEFVWPLTFVPPRILKLIDKLTHPLRFVPIINLLGGSVAIMAKKHENLK